MTRRRSTRAGQHPAAGVRQGLTLEAALEQALAFHRDGNLETAELLYRQVLAANPGHFEALHHLGTLKAQSGQYDEARHWIAAALAIEPWSAEANLNLGHVLAKRGRLEEALASYDRALAANPRFAEALFSRGNALQYSGRREEALASYDAALVILPGWAEALCNRANALHDLKRHEEALASYDEAIAAMPGVALLHSNRANTLRELKRFEEALVELDRALALEPANVEALNNRGNALRDLGRFAEALRSYDAALAGSPGNAAVHNNRGNVLRDLMRHEEAISSYDKALAINPAFADALVGRGDALQERRRFQEAMQSYDKALAIAPDYADALVGRGNVLHELQRHEEAAASYRKALAVRPDLEYAAGMIAKARMDGCEWRDRGEEIARLAADVRAGKRSIPPLTFIGLSDSAHDQHLCSRIWARDNYPASPVPVWKGERYRHQRIRVAYLSADFREHVVAYCLAPLIEAHDRAKFEIIGISFGPDAPGRFRSRLEGAFDRFIDVRGNEDREVANLMRAMEIDIAVDLQGFTGRHRTRIFAFRAVPIQVNYLGYPGTMGTDYIDYVLADRVVVPDRDRPHYAEKVVYLPDTYLVTDSTRGIAKETPTRAQAGLPERGFVFSSFNDSYKIAPPVFDVWMRLLGKIEGSVLWLRDTRAATRNLRKEAVERGIAPERLVFAARVESMEDHLARYKLADLALDTLPYNGHATTGDALWAGLPVLTCLGTTFAGRVAGSLLSAIGLNELITHSLEEYEALALQLAGNPEQLAGIKSKLAFNRNTHPLFDTGRFRRHIEAAYTAMWERCQRGELPESFAVEPLPGE